MHPRDRGRQRRFTVILSADIAGYTSLMERDEAGKRSRLNEDRASLCDLSLATRGGRLTKLISDSALVEFSSAAASCWACAALAHCPVRYGRHKPIQTQADTSG